MVNKKNNKKKTGYRKLRCECSVAVVCVFFFSVDSHHLVFCVKLAIDWCVMVWCGVCVCWLVGERHRGAEK